MEDNENEEKQLAGDGQVLDSSLGDLEVTHEQEGSSIAVKPVDENEHPGGLRPEDNELDQRGAEDESLVQHGVANENLVEDEREPVNEAYQMGEEPSVNVPDEPNDDQDVSEGAEVMVNRDAGIDVIPENHHDPVTPNSLMRCSNGKTDDDSKGTSKDWLGSPMLEDDESGTPEEQAAFMKELECFYRERAMDFKPPKFYQQPLNLLKLWRAVIKLGGYDLVTGTKLWRQVGESFHPPKTCTTVSWTFRIFYEKALLEYERYKSQSGELQLAAAQPEFSVVDNEANGFQAPGSSGRVRRDSAARAMQGWHVQRLFSHGDGAEPIVKDKNSTMPKREKSLKSIGSHKQKRPAEVEHTLKAVRTETGKQVVATVEDAGPPADWVKINVREDKDCFEVYALVPGLLREEVRVQSDPAGRLVITGQPEQLDNPWGITAFRKVVNLPARIDPLQTSAVVSLHGRLYVRVPFEQSDI